MTTPAILKRDGTRATIGRLLAIGLLLGFLPQVAAARGLGFGLLGGWESIHEIAPVGLIGPRGERLVLAHKVTTYMVVAGVGLTDDGYVLACRGNSERYLELSRERIAELQRQGLLPSPLPRYRIPFYKYLLGFSLWLILAVRFLAKAGLLPKFGRLLGWGRRDDYITGGRA